MHRIRTWARQKAHGPTPLVADPRRPAGTRPRPSSTPGVELVAGGGPPTGGDGPPTSSGSGAASSASVSASATATGTTEKPPKPKVGVAKRFFKTTKDILLSSVVNVLLVFVPVGIAAHFAHLSAGIVFAMNAIAIIPLAGLLSHATESVASRLGDTVGALLNVTFGNAVELIIFIIALVKNEIHIVQASLVGSILANLLLILGMCFLLGGLRYREQIYNSTVTQMSACLLSLSVSSLLLPTAFHASFSDSVDADSKVLKVSRGTSVVLLLVYLLYLLFQLNSHAYMYESTPQDIIEREMVPGPAASYFNSSSSSSSSSDSSDSDTSAASDQSRGTAGRIKHAFRTRFRRGSSNSNSDAAAAAAGEGQSVASEEGGGGDGESRNSTTGEGLAPSSTGEGGVTLAGNDDAADDEADHDDVQEDSKRKHRSKKKQKHKKRSKRASTDGDAAAVAAAAGTATAFAASAGHGHGHGHDDDVRRVDFALAPDAEAQTAPRPKPFSLRALASPAVLGKTLSFSMFAGGSGQASSDHEQGGVPAQAALALAHGATAPAYAHPPHPPHQLRRTASLPAVARGNTAAGPNARPLPPIVPIVVNRTPRTTTGGGGRGRGVGDNGDGNGNGNDDDDDDDDDDDNGEISRTTAVLLLLVSTGLVALCAEFMVDSINAVVEGNSGLSRAFIGLILLPIVGNAAEHVTGVTVAMKNKMDLALGVALGSSIQIAIFVTPVVVLLGWILKKDMSLYFTLFETVSMFVSAFIVNFLVLDGRSNYLEGALLCAAYVIIAVAAFFYPDEERANALGGGTDNNSTAAAAAAVDTARLLVRGVVQVFAS